MSDVLERPTSSTIEKELPTNYRTRWTSAKKEAVVRGVQDGAITLGNALDRYRLSRTEFSSWQHSYAASGKRGLLAKELQIHR